jgi:hypothetical protein
VPGADLPVEPADPPEALLTDLHLAAGKDGRASWELLAGAEDPAVRALAARWSG